METKVRRETHSRDFGCCLHMTSSTCPFCVQLSTVSMYNFMKAYICIKNIQVRLAADSIQKRASAFIILVSICTQKRHLGGCCWGWGREQPYTPCYMVKFANQNFILPKINYIIGKFYLLREVKNFRDSSPGSLIPLALVLGSALWGRTWWSRSADLIPKRLKRQREKTRDPQHPNAFH